jgi:hypothetical protein
VDAFLKERLSSLAEKEAKHYNDNAPLGEAIQEAVAISDILIDWPQELRALSQEVGAESVKALVQSEKALVLPEGEVKQQVAEGLCALMWARPALDLDLNGRKMAPECLTVLCRALRTSVMSLSLSKTDFAKDGNDLSGMRHLCAALRDERRGGGLRTLELDENSLKADAGRMLAEAIAVSGSLTSIDIGYNKINQESALELLAAMKSKEMASIGMANCSLGVEGAKIVAEMAAVSKSLTSINLQENRLTDYGKDYTGVNALADAISVSKSLTSINLAFNGFIFDGFEAEAAKALGSAISVSKSLTSIE